MSILDLISKKKNKQDITESEFDFFIKGVLDKSIKDYQISAFLMAIYFNKLNFNETYFMTKAMVENGLKVEYDGITDVIVDKHSTGGVGDKVSLILVPILAALNIKVAKMSGRGLGYTGGTVDKLESVGVKTEISEKKALSLLKKHNMFIIAQNKNIAPSDKILYAIRDTSQTVDNMSLIATSIMSKKIATNTDKIYLDVKIGDGAFFKTQAEAKEFGNLCIKLGKKFKKKVVVHLTNMSKPLGRSLGNLIEIKESLAFLKGFFESEELKELIYEFVTDILIDLKRVKTKKDAIQKIDEIIESNKAYNLFKEWAFDQDSRYNFDDIENDFTTKFKTEIKASQNGYVDFVSNKVIGLSLIDIKAGRLNKDEKLDFYSGIYLNKVSGEFANSGETIMTVYANNEISNHVITKLEDNIVYKNEPLKKNKIILGVIK